MIGIYFSTMINNLAVKLLEKACAHKISPTSHIHEGGKNHTYAACEKTFTDKASLMMHFATHTGYVQYKYSICGAAYSHEVK